MWCQLPVRRQQDSWRGSQQGHSSGNEGYVVHKFTSSRLWKAIPDELLCIRGTWRRIKLNHELHQCLFSFAPHFAGHFQHIRISRTPPNTCTASPISHRLREPFPPARPDHSSLLFPGNSDCWQGGYCSLQAASSAPEHLGTFEPLLSQIGMTNPSSTWGMLCNQRGCKDGSRQRSILLSL